MTVAKLLYVAYRWTCTIDLCAGVRVSWDQDVSANEGSAASVCAVAMDPTEKSFSVEIVPPSLEGWSIGRHYYYSVCTLCSLFQTSV